VIIAVDGPAASGKGTIAARLARHYGLAHLDTGLLYRAVGLAVFDFADDPDFESMAVAAAKSLDTSGLDPELLGTAEAGMAASRVSRIEEVRAALRELQTDFAHQPSGAVLDGRDIGSRICPDADVKFWITASPEARARRRTGQLLERGLEADEADIYDQILARDDADRNNPAGAFWRADDAHLLDTTEMDIEAAFRAAVAIVDGATKGGDRRKTP
jgi:cytidylate kinase